jgi:hypothetical protein
MYYNNRLQPCRISVKTTGTAPTSCADTTAGNVMDFTYGFNLGVADNGNAQSIANNINTARSQTYTYDELNRVTTAKTSATSGTYSWGLAFTYDPWANLLSASVTQGSAYSFSVYADGSNRIHNTGGTFTYDAAGNLTADPVNSAYTYNAEGELTAAAGVTYTYDGDGNRVKKSSGKLYWYGVGSDPLSESDASGNLTNEYIFLNGARTSRRLKQQHERQGNNSSNNRNMAASPMVPIEPIRHKCQKQSIVKTINQLEMVSAYPRVRPFRV